MSSRNKQDQFNEMKREFRRLSIGRAKLTDRIAFLREMLKFASSSRLAAPEEIAGMEEDLKKYELHWILNVCEDLSQGRDHNKVRYRELSERYLIANKFSNEIKENPDYINAFQKIQRAYYFRYCWTVFLVSIVVVALCGAGSLGVLSFMANNQLGNLAQRLESGTTGSVQEQVSELNRIQTELMDAETAMRKEEQKRECRKLQEKCAQKIQVCRETLLENITSTVGNSKQFYDGIETYLSIFPNEKLSSRLNFEILPCIPKYETLLTYNRFWEAAQNVEFPTKFPLDSTLESPCFIPEWQFISQYDSFKDQLTLAKEKELLKWTEEFFAKHDYAVMKEWAYCRKKWDRCYYSSSAPIYSKENNKYTLTVTLQDGSSKKFRFGVKPERAYSRLN